LQPVARSKTDPACHHAQQGTRQHNDVERNAGPASPEAHCPEICDCVFCGRGEADGMIEIQHVGGDVWLVTVKDSDTTQHRVRVTSTDLDRWAEGRSAEELLAESFRFLLEREPNTSILATFDLPVINRYFPEYDCDIRVRLSDLV
jgi:hypothetical protein